LKHGLFPNTPDSNEDFREFAKDLVLNLLDRVSEMGYVNGVWFNLTECNLSNTDASMRSIFNGVCFDKHLHRETQIEVLNLSYTHTTPRSLLSLHRLLNLHTLNLDHCPSLQKQGKTIFNLLTKNY